LVLAFMGSKNRLELSGFKELLFSWSSKVGTANSSRN
jgi:hypothetical protein